MKAEHAVAHAFIKEGTSTVFGLLGDSQLAWWAEMAKHPGMQIVDARDEGAAVAMADGWARATGKVGVASVTHGPGLSRTATSLITATRYRTPLVVHTGATPFNKGQALQYMDQEKLVSATGAGCIEALTPDYAETAVRDAFYRAQVEQRPIVLSIPSDVQSKECNSKGDAYQPSSAILRGRQRIRPDLDRLQDAVKILAAANKPIIMVGRGALEPECVKIIERLGQRLGALIAPTLHAKGVLGDSEYYAGIAGLFSSKAMVQFCAEADCVLALGTSMHSYAVMVKGKPLYANARVVHVDAQPHLMMGSGKGADCYIQGDALATAAALDELLEKANVKKTGFRTAAVAKALRDAGDRDEREIEPGTVDPREAARIMDDLLPPQVGLVVGDGHYMSFPIMLMKKRRGPHIFSTAFGSIGQGLSTAIGATLGVNAPLLCVEGDGGALQNIQELDTAARLGIRLLYVVMNDEAYGAEYHKLKTKKLDHNLSAVRSPDFAAVAKGFGCAGRTAKSNADVESAVQEFLAGKGPMVIDIKTSRNVVSIPYRRMHLGEDV